MSKASRAFERNAVHQHAAGYDWERSDYHSYHDRPPLYDDPKSFPEDALQFVPVNRFVKVRSSTTTATQVFIDANEYFEKEIRPWLEENRITKYRTHKLVVSSKSHDSVGSWVLLEGWDKNMLAAFALTFKRKAHAVLFKLTFL